MAPSTSVISHIKPPRKSPIEPFIKVNNSIVSGLHLLLKAKSAKPSKPYYWFLHQKRWVRPYIACFSCISRLEQNSSLSQRRLMTEYRISRSCLIRMLHTKLFWQKLSLGIARLQRCGSSGALICVVAFLRSTHAEAFSAKAAKAAAELIVSIEKVCSSTRSRPEKKRPSAV